MARSTPNPPFKFTERSVAALQPGAKRRTWHDTEVRELGLLLQPSGHRSYFMFFRVNGRAEWHTLGDSFTWESTDMDETIAKGRHAWSVAADKLASGDYQLLILDELTYAVKYGWVDVADVVTAVENRADKTNVVITGRDCPDEIVALADTVTEMRKVKHAYDAGIAAKKGIDY